MPAFFGAGGLLAAVTVAVGSSPAAMAATASPWCANGTCTVTFATPGTGQSFTVPAGVSSLSVTLYGGAGGQNYQGDVPGGDGAEVTADVAVSPGDGMSVDVGGAGGTPSGGNLRAAGGINGGGYAWLGGGGGGFSQVNDSAMSEYFLFAGGGGGAGADEFETECSLVREQPGGAGGNADTNGSPGADYTLSGADIEGGRGGHTSFVEVFPEFPVFGGLGGSYITASYCGHTGSSNGVEGDATDGKTGATGGINELVFPPGPGEGSGGGGGGGWAGGGAGGTGAVETDGAAYIGGGDGGGGGGTSGMLTNSSVVSNYAVDDTGNSGQVNGGNGEVVLSYADLVSTGPVSYGTTAGQSLSVTAGDGLLSAGAGTSGPASDPLTASGPASGDTAAGGSATVSPDGSFSYTAPSPAFTGSDSFTYTVTDASGDYATGTAAIDVQPIAQNVSFTTSPPSPAVAGGATYTPAAAGGASGNPVTFSIDPASTTGACSISSGVVSFTAAGTCIVDASQAGGGGYAPGQASQPITVDQAPAFVVDSPPLTATTGHLYDYTFTASGTPTPVYALAAGAPPWLSVNPSTGEVSGTPPKGTTSFSYQVTATNLAGTATAGPFSITVTTATAKQADLAVTLSCPAHLKVGSTGKCTLKITNGGPNAASKVTAAMALPAGLAEVSCSNGCTRDGNVFTWTRAFLAVGGSATHTITVRAAAAGQAQVAANASAATADPHPGNDFTTATIAIKS